MAPIIAFSNEPGVLEVNALEIRCNLLLKGKTLVDVARETGVSPAFVSSVLRGKKGNHVARHISRLTGIPLDELWPGVYGYTPRERYCERNTERRAA